MSIYIFNKFFLVFLMLLFVSPAAAEEEEEEVKEKEITTSGWARVDHDRFGFAGTVGGVHKFNETFGIISDVFFVQQQDICDGDACSTVTFGEFDFGVAIETPAIQTYPMLGFGIAWEMPNQVVYVPQLYSYAAVDKFNFLLWNIYNIGGGFNTLLNRFNITYQLHSMLGLGPQVELNADFNLGEVTYLPLGGRANIKYNDRITLALFPAYDFIGETFAGRISVIYNW